MLGTAWTFCFFRALRFLRAFDLFWTLNFLRAFNFSYALHFFGAFDFLVALSHFVFFDFFNTLFGTLAIFGFTALLVAFQAALGVFQAGIIRVLFQVFVNADQCLA